MEKLRITKLLLESGQELHDLEIAYRTFGTLNKNKSNVIWVFHAISGDVNVTEWWSGLFGKDKIYDPDKYFIICVNCIASPFGSTKPTNLDFPQITVRDQVQAFILLAKSLNIDKLHTAIGGSFGGYLALEFAYCYDGTIANLILLASSAKESAWGIAIHEAQRMALKADPSFGKENQGHEGLKAARALAMLTYRTSDKLIKDQTDINTPLDDFKASSYLNYQGHKFSEKFDALCLYYLTKCIDSHNIGRGRGSISTALQKINLPTLIIGFTSDLLVPIESQRYLSQHLPLSTLVELSSTYGHDGFLMEHEVIASKISEFYKKKSNHIQRSILKFGGSSLYGREHLQNVLDIVNEASKKQAIALVVSARGKSTDMLIQLVEIANQGMNFEKEYDDFVKYSTLDIPEIDITKEITVLKNTLDAIKLLRIDSKQIRDKVLVYGELISAKVISTLLKHNKHKSEVVDARDYINCSNKQGSLEIDFIKSQKLVLQKIQSIDADCIPVFTGYIARDEDGNSVTLGRNGSNVSASVIAQFIQAKEVQNWSDVEGIFSADPRKVSNAVHIKKMNYQEANELACFGMNLLHPKTILPLMQSDIPLHIKSTKYPNKPGTIINKEGGAKGIKAITSVENVALLSVIGDQLKDNVGIDARIFSCLQLKKINVKMISQASTENGIGFIVDAEDAKAAELSLKEEFKNELNLNHINTITSKKDIGIIAIIGRHNFSLEKAIKTLRKNGIWMHLISNSISGKNISLVVDSQYLNQALLLVHNEVYGAIKTINVLAFGKGKVGSEFINQVFENADCLVKERKAVIKFIGICDSQKYIINPEGLSYKWKPALQNGRTFTNHSEIISTLKKQFLNDVVIVDNTASEKLSNLYLKFINNNFDIVASNKTLNSGNLHRYQAIQKALLNKGKSFFFETNVGAGLPIIGLLQSLQQSSDKVQKIKGVFSGSLSYIFNSYSVSEKPFSYFIELAIDKGFAEPDPRSDLSGLDVGRKLVILARVLKLNLSIEDVSIENLVPKNLQNIKSLIGSQESKEELNAHYQEIKNTLKANEVLRYVAELDVGEENMKIELKKVKQHENLAQIKNADNYFEIYTECYNERPIILQGKGAGPKVTAKGVYSDVLKLI